MVACSFSTCSRTNPAIIDSRSRCSQPRTARNKVSDKATPSIATQPIHKGGRRDVELSVARNKVVVQKHIVCRHEILSLPICQSARGVSLQWVKDRTLIRYSTEN